MFLSSSKWEVPWQCRGWDATISLPRLQLQSLAGELRSCKLWSTVTNKQIPLVIEFWVLPDNSEVHLKFLKLITTAKTSLTNKLSARGSGGEAVDMSLGPPFKPPQASTESPFCPSLPCPPKALCAGVPFQPPGTPAPDATPPPNFWD